LVQAVAQRGNFDGVRNPALLADLMERRKALVTTDASPETRLARALDALPDEEVVVALERELRDPAFSFKDRSIHILRDA
jgi:hypothetical protein